MWDHTSDSHVNIATKFTFATGVCRSSGVYKWLQPQTLYSSKQCLCSKQNNCALPPPPPSRYHDDQWWKKAGVRDHCPQNFSIFYPTLDDQWANTTAGYQQENRPELLDLSQTWKSAGRSCCNVLFNKFEHWRHQHCYVNERLCTVLVRVGSKWQQITYA